MTADTYRRPAPRASITSRVLSLVLTLTILLGGSVLPHAATEVFAAGTPCIDTGPGGGSWYARLCITTPLDGAVLTGTVSLTATVTPLAGTVPPIKVMRFYLTKASSSSSSSLAADTTAPYTVQVPTARWVDGSYRLAATVNFTDGSLSSQATVIVQFANGVTSPPGSTGTWTPKTSGASPLRLVAVGDGAGGMPGSYDVGNLAVSQNPDLFFYLGDVYNSGTYTEFMNYYDPTLGPLNDRADPVPGNHEGGNHFQGYRDYWNINNFYYSFDSGGWHFIALDSNSGTAAGSAQYNWLSQDLSAHAGTVCTLVFFHHPRYGLASDGGSAAMQDIWSLMALNGVDVVLNGHEHNYQRWRPMNNTGQLTASGGIIEYVVGTGGHESMGFNHSDSRVASRLRADGVLSLTLGAGGGSSRFITTAGATADETSFNCANDPGQTSPTPTPTVTPDPSSPLDLEPIADAMVSATNPTTNYGTASNLRADLSPNEESYLMFDVQGLTSAPTKATLRLWVRDGTTDAPQLALSPDTAWTEGGITWNTKPATGRVVGDLGAVSTGTWIEYDVTSAITGNGRVSFALLSQSSNALSVNSRNNTDNRPRLVLERDGAGSPTPSASPSPTPTETPGPGGSLPFLPAADARVESARPVDNFGKSTVLRMEGGKDPAIESYVRFSVTGLSGAPAGATLRFFVPTNTNAGSSKGPSLYTAASNAWSEIGISWANRPERTTTALGSLGAVSSGTWVEFDVSSVITGNGDYTFVLASTSTDATDFASRETANAPQLVLAGAGTTATPSPSPSPSPSPTASATPTETPAPGGSSAFTTGADARVEEANPTGNFGKSTRLQTDGGRDPQEVSYLTFTVTGLSGAPDHAVVRLFVNNSTNSGSVDGPAIYQVADTSWNESTLTWANRPAGSGTALDDLGPVALGTWVELDVTSAITGNGTYSFLLAGVSSDGTGFASRETENKPQLVVTASSSQARSAAPAAARREVPNATPPASPAASPEVEPQVTQEVRDAPALIASPEPAVDGASPTPGTTVPASSPEPSPEMATATEAEAEVSVPPATTLGTITGTGGEGLRCRAEPSTDATILMVIPEGQQVNIRGPREGDWLPVTCDGQDGFASASFITTGNPGDEPGPAAPESSPTVAESTAPSPQDAEVPTLETTAEPTPAPAGEVAQPEPTPLSVVAGWQTDPAIPWWLVTDQNLTTSWSGYVSDPATPAELGLDLGVLTPIDHLRWQPTWPMQGMMEIQLSADDVNWYRLRSIDLSRQSPDQWAEIPVHVQARFIKLVFTTPTGTGAVGAICEMEAWPGSGGPAAPVTSLSLVVPTPTPTPTPSPTVIVTQPTAAPTMVPPPPTAVPAPTEAPVVQQPPPTPEPTIVENEPVEPPPPPPAEGTPSGS